ncbi:hypothetical protein QUW13_07080 [Enterococcus hirae]|nr:hypothetical protein [Enterococcus hirae]
MIKKIIGAVAMLAIISIGVYSGVGIYHHLKQNQKTAQRVSKVEATKKDDEKKAEKSIITQAEFLGKQYNYEAALKLLQDKDAAKDKKAKALSEQLKKEEEQLIVWPDNGKISHLFFHSLIADPARAFDGDSKDQGYRDYMVTVDEFKKILDQLYKNQFVLVAMKDIVADQNGKMTYQEIKLPEGKKPLVISQDDVNYYEYMDGDGFAKNLTIKDGKVVNTYIDAAGKIQYGAYDMAPIIDEFVNEHPDFSYRGAKGILALTGYNGTLGYRSSVSEYGDNEKTKAEGEKAKKVAEALRNDGWEFASHSWGHLNFTKTPLPNLEEDTSKWKNEVAPLIGDSDILIYPFGADISDIKPYDGNPKYDYLKGQGFKVYCNVDASVPAWAQLEDGYLRQARINVDGIRFKSELDGKNTVLNEFFDTKSVIDPIRTK